MNLTRRLKQLTETGVSKFDAETRPLVRAANVISMIAIGISVANALAFTSMVPWYVLVANTTGSLLLYVLPIILNSFGRRLLASAAIGVAANLQLILLPVLFNGSDFGIHYYLITVPTLTLLTLKASREYILFVFNFISSMAGLVYCEFFLEAALYPVKIKGIDLNIIRITSIVGAVAMVCFVMFIAMVDLSRARQDIKKQFTRAEELLHNILPVPIADRLKDERATIADGFSAATVLFADMVGFTELASRTRPEELVRILNRFFTSYDDLCTEFGVERNPIPNLGVYSHRIFS